MNISEGAEVKMEIEALKLNVIRRVESECNRNRETESK